MTTTTSPAKIGQALNVYMTSVGCMIFKSMNDARENNGATRLGFDPDPAARVQPYASPEFLVCNWKATAQLVDGKHVLAADGKSYIAWKAPPKYRVTKTTKDGTTTHEVEVRKFLNCNESGKFTLAGIFVAIVEEFTAYKNAVGVEPSSDFGDYINKVIRYTDTQDRSSNLHVAHSIISRGDQHFKCEPTAAILAYTATAEKTLKDAVEALVPKTRFGSEIHKFMLKFMTQLAFVLANAAFDSLINPIDMAKIISALRQFNYSQQVANDECFLEEFLIRIEQYTAKAIASKPKKATKAAGADASSDSAVVNDADEDNSEETDAAAEPVAAEPAAAAPAKKTRKPKAAAAAAPAAAESAPAPAEPAATKRGKKAAAAPAPAPAPAPIPAEVNDDIDNWAGDDDGDEDYDATD